MRYNETDQFEGEVMSLELDGPARPAQRYAGGCAHLVHRMEASTPSGSPTMPEQAADRQVLLRVQDLRATEEQWQSVTTYLPKTADLDQAPHHRVVSAAALAHMARRALGYLNGRDTEVALRFLAQGTAIHFRLPYHLLPTAGENRWRDSRWR